MPGEPTLLRTLITARHWQRYETFAVQFKRAARKLADEEGEDELAKMSVSARQFERWYGGKLRTLPHPDACRILEHMFGYPVQQLLAPADRPSQETSLILGQDDPRPAPARQLKPAQGVIWSARDADPRRFQDPTKRIPPRLIRKGFLPWQHWRAMRFSATAGSSNIGGESLDQLWAETSRLAVAYPQQPLSVITGDIVSLQDIVFTLLEGRQRPAESRDLYIIGGLASGMLSKASHDLRDPGHCDDPRPNRHCCAANNAEHASLAAWVRGLQSLITYWALRPREALEYAQIGQQLPGTTGIPVTVWLASLEARAWARLQQQRRGRSRPGHRPRVGTARARSSPAMTWTRSAACATSPAPASFTTPATPGPPCPSTTKSGPARGNRGVRLRCHRRLRAGTGRGEVLRRRGRLTKTDLAIARASGRATSKEPGKPSSPSWTCPSRCGSTGSSPASWTCTAPSRREPQTPRWPATSRKRSKPTAGRPQRRCRASTEPGHAPSSPRKAPR